MSLEDLQRKIKTTKEMRDIVSTMKTLSSVSILQYEQANAALEKYRRNLRDAFQALIQKYGLPPEAKSSGAAQKHLIIMIGSDNGMVGKFNREVVQGVRQQLRQLGILPRQALFLPIGKRMGMLVEQQRWPVFAKYGISNSVKVVSTLAENIILRIDEAIRKEKINHVSVWFHRHKKSAAVSLDYREIIPFDMQALKRLKDKSWGTNNIPLMTLELDCLSSALIREWLMISMASFLNASLASEHRTRMTNMQNAEQNIDENLEELDKIYQQQRQEEITDELIDVVSGFEAMKK